MVRRCRGGASTKHPPTPAAPGGKGLAPLPPTRRQREPQIWGGRATTPPPSVWRRRERSGRGVRATPHPPAAAAGAAGERLGAPPLLFGSNFPGYTFLWLISICRVFSQKSEERAEKYVLPSIKTSKITKKSPAAPGKNALFYSIKTSKITKKSPAAKGTTSPKKFGRP